MIAVSRVISAILLLTLLATGSFTAAPLIEPDKLFALAFAAVALVSLIVSLTNWYLDFTLSGPFILVDVLAFFVLVTSHSILDVASVTSALWLMAHILFASGLRWRMSTVAIMAALLITIWIADIVLSDLPKGDIDPGSAVRWILVAAVIAVTVLWASTRLSAVILPRFERDDPIPGLPHTASAFSYAMTMSGASGAALCWIDRDSAACFGLGAGALEETVPPTPTKLGFSAAAAFKKLEPMIFDLAHNRSIVADSTHRPVRAIHSVPGHPLLGELGIESGICTPIDSQEGRCWLILTGFPLLGWGHLPLASAICAEIVHGINWQIASAHARHAALLRLRRTLAGDLHDSVAHSLAGAKFLLVALRSKVSRDREIAAEIDTITAALETEHQHVRKVITQLRGTDSDAYERDLVDDLQVILSALATRWQIDAELTDSDFRMHVPVLLSLEIQQIVREAIGNAVRHGKAGRIAVKCRRSLETILLEVTDNGSGFADPQNPVRPRSISERLNELGGTLEIVTERAATTLRITIPSPAAE